MIWILYRKSEPGRAPSLARMEDYDEIGEVVAGTRREAATKWLQSWYDDEDRERFRPPVTGDLILNKKTKEAYILTPNGIWASVELKT